MKRFIGYAARALAGAFLLAACSDDEPAIPAQPDFIVVGRPITAAEDPVAAYRRCVAEFVG